MNCAFTRGSVKYRPLLKLIKEKSKHILFFHLDIFYFGLFVIIFISVPVRDPPGFSNRHHWAIYARHQALA